MNAAYVEIKRIRWLLRLPPLILAAGLSACAIAPHQTEPVRITILHTNDHHGHFWKNADNEYGLAARKTLIDGIRQEVRAGGGHVLLLDGGDVNTGVPESDMQDAEPDFRGMSYLGYDAMAVGNHEFDKSLPVQRRQQGEWSSFPWLSANIYRQGERMFEPYRLFEKGGVRIAVMGLTTEDTGKILNTGKYPAVSFASPIEEAGKLVPELRHRADVVIAATHMGHYTDGRHGVNAPGDVELARAVPGIDLVVGGHSQNVVCMLEENVRNDAYEPGGPCAPDRQNGAWIVQAGEWGKFVGRADFEYRAGQFKLIKYTLIPVNLKAAAKAGEGAPAKRTHGPEIAEDAGMLALLQPYQDRGSAELLVPIGRSKGKFDGDRADVRYRPTSLGKLITTAMMEKTGADVAVVSGGGIRDSLPAGTLTYRDLLKAQPFGNHVVTIAMTGEELGAYVRALARMTPGSGAFPQYSGLRFKAGAGEAGDMQVEVRGKPVQAAATYRVALNSFIARGGDGYPDLTKHRNFVNTGWVDADVLREFISTRGMLDPAEFEPAR